MTIKAIASMDMDKAPNLGAGVGASNLGVIVDREKEARVLSNVPNGGRADPVVGGRATLIGASGQAAADQIWHEEGAVGVDLGSIRGEEVDLGTIARQSVQTAGLVLRDTLGGCPCR
ncbi:unnamed protein product [Ilex paraguariensis]|uniref:Uncharacterized protein n=1 Tax=Ilex paraguariensis TaxID=185542 RepID=A0ABC8R1Q6_9AQUA